MDRFQILEPNCWIFRNPCGQSMTVHGLLGLFMVQICVMNDALMCIRPEMAVKLGFTK